MQLRNLNITHKISWKTHIQYEYFKSKLHQKTECCVIIQKWKGLNDSNEDEIFYKLAEHAWGRQKFAPSHFVWTCEHSRHPASLYGRRGRGRDKLFATVTRTFSFTALPHPFYVFHSSTLINKKLTPTLTYPCLSISGQQLQLPVNHSSIETIQVITTPINQHGIW